MGSQRSKNDHYLFAKTETERGTFTLVCVDGIIVESRRMTAISDAKKALEAIFHRQRETTIVSGPQNQTRRGQGDSRSGKLHINNF